METYYLGFLRKYFNNNRKRLLETVHKSKRTEDLRCMAYASSAILKIIPEATRLFLNLYDLMQKVQLLPDDLVNVFAISGQLEDKEQH